MNVSAPFIRRPVATTLLGLGLVLAGLVAFRWLPVAPLPRVDVPTIKVSASLPGASPETMAAAVATPLERALGQIAGITEMTSTSSAGATTIRLTFDFARDIDGAARDVAGALNAARGELPPDMPQSPSYRAVTSADAPIMVLGLTSRQLTPGQMYGAASTKFVQVLSQIDGVGEVDLVGGSLPAIGVHLDPAAMNRHGVGFVQVRAALATARAEGPAGAIAIGQRHWQVAMDAGPADVADFNALVVAQHAGASLHLGAIARVVSGSVDPYNAGRVNGQPGVLAIILRKPGANMLQTIDRITRQLPALRASLPGTMSLSVVVDRATTVRASLRDAERALAAAVLLVVLVMLLFLRDGRAALIASVAAPISLIGTLAIMYLLGYSLDNLSLMALTIGVGFAVDDAVVVTENVMRHLERGVPAQVAARVGAGEIGLTVLSMSMALVAVFIPLLLMGGYVGLFVREFAVTIAIVVAVSLVVALTVVPMLCAWWLRDPRPRRRRGRLYRTSERAFARLLWAYRKSLAWTLRHARVTLLVLLGVIGLNVYLYAVVPKGFFPRQDTGELAGSVNVDAGGSFALTERKLRQFVDIVRADPAVQSVAGYARRDGGSLFASLEPLGHRGVSADAVAERLRARLATVAGATFSLQSVQDIRVGGRRSRASYQYTLQADSLAALRRWEPRVRAALATLPELRDVRSDSQGEGLETRVQVDRDMAARHGVSFTRIDNVLHDAFAGSRAATVYTPLNPYPVVMGVAPQYAQSAQALQRLQVQGAGGQSVPLSVLAHSRAGSAPLGIDHAGQFVAQTIAFDLAQGVSLSRATRAIRRAVDRLAMPVSVRGSFAGSAQAFRQVLSDEPVLIATALLTLFIVLGVLYESYVHPLTILSTLPSAGVGALLALLAFDMDFSVIALIGVFALVGIVMKNAIMMVDFALVAQREGHATPHVAVYRACLLRFRPILMTSLAVLLAAVPLAVLRGNGAEMRQPLGIAIGGGLIMSQVLTLYTTPVVYLCLERAQRRLGHWLARVGRRRRVDGVRPASGSAA